MGRIIQVHMMTNPATGHRGSSRPFFGFVYFGV